MPQQVFKEKVLGVTAERQSTQWVTWQTRARSTRGTRQRQGWALIYSQADTAHGELRAACKKAQGIGARAFKKCICMEKSIRNWTTVLLQAPDGCSESEPSGDPPALLYHSLTQVWGKSWGWNRIQTGLWPDEMCPGNSSPDLSSCSNPSPGRGHTWNFGHINLAKFPETGWTSHLQQTSGVSCSWGYLNLRVSGRVSRCFATRQLLTSFQQLFSSTAHVIFPTFFSIKRSSSLPGKIFSFPTKHYPKISLWALLIKSKLLILLSAPRSRTSLFSKQDFKIQDFLNQLLHSLSCRAISHPNLSLFQTAFITPRTINPGASHMSAIRNSLFCLCYVIPVRSYLCSPQARIKNECVSYLKKIEALLQQFN